MHEALVRYIEKSIEDGTSPKELKAWLLRHGYTEQILVEALGGNYNDYFHESHFEIYIDTLLFSIGIPIVLLSALFFLHSFRFGFSIFIDYILIGLISMFISLIMTDLYTRRPVSDPQLITCIFLTSLISCIIPSMALFYQKQYDLAMIKLGEFGINVDVFEVTPKPVILSMTILFFLLLPFIVFLIKRGQVNRNI